VNLGFRKNRSVAINFAVTFFEYFPEHPRSDADHLWSLFTVGVNMRHGSMIVVAEDAASESMRLSDQGTPIRPAQMTPELLERVSEIDGSILLDPDRRLPRHRRYLRWRGRE
jgi:hypothetical protein